LGQVRRWSNTGQILVKHWSYIGSLQHDTGDDADGWDVVRSAAGQILVKYRSNAGQILVNHHMCARS
jgi:hypothetical protein